MDILTIRDIVKNAENEFGGNIALQMRTESGAFEKWTYSDAVRQIKQLIHSFIKLGIKPGDKIAILSENRPEWSISYLAITSFGAVAVPLDSLAENALLGRVLEHSEAKCLIFSSKFRAFVDELKHKIICVNFDLLADDHKCLSFRGLLGKEASWDELPTLPEKDLAAIVYTSGTTGTPKGVMLSHGNIVSNVKAANSLFDIGQTDRLLSVLPLHHTLETTTSFLTGFIVGGTVTHSESLKSTRIIRNMQDTRQTILIGVPLLYQIFYEGILREVEDKGFIASLLFRIMLWISKLLNMFKINIGRQLFFFIHKKLGGSIRFWVTGGAAINKELLVDYNAIGITIYQGYGLTESSPILTACNKKNNKFGSVGRAIPGVEIKIDKPDSKGIGEIAARGPNIMQGYFKNPEATAEVLKEGWLYTGDLGYVDKQGFVYISGRIKDVIVSSAGVNIYPDELEFELNKLPYIKESCVIGRKATSGVRKGSEDVFAVIQPDFEYLQEKNMGTEKHTIHEAVWNEVRKLNETLPMQKMITGIEIRMEDFPKTSTKKIKRYQVRKEMELLWRT